MKLVFCILILLIIIINIIRIYLIKKENLQIEKRLKYMEQLRVGVELKVDEIRKYRHDLSKHVNMLKILIAKDCDFDEIKSYIQENMAEQVSDTSENRDDILNTLLYIKKKECVEKNISLDLSVQAGCCDFMAEADKVGLFLNLLENALEATEKISDFSRRRISLSICNEDDELMIRLINPVLKTESLSFVSKKKDKDLHGFGTRIIKDILDKYSGVRNTRLDISNGMWIDELRMTKRSCR